MVYRCLYPVHSREKSLPAQQSIKPPSPPRGASPTQVTPCSLFAGCHRSTCHLSLSLSLSHTHTHTPRCRTTRAQKHPLHSSRGIKDGLCSLARETDR
jgi:hypothetical protein